MLRESERERASARDTGEKGVGCEHARRCGARAKRLVTHPDLSRNRIPRVPRVPRQLEDVHALI